MAHIVIVDDDYNNTKLMSMLLEMDGFDVTISPDVKHARDAATSGIDAFVVDCYLTPGEDGIGFLREIRSGATAASPDTPVIMTSGDDRMFEASKEAGATNFLLKPFSPSELSSELSNLLK